MIFFLLLTWINQFLRYVYLFLYSVTNPDPNFVEFDWVCVNLRKASKIKKNKKQQQQQEIVRNPELVGLFLSSQLTHIVDVNVGLYREDGPATYRKKKRPRK